MFNLFVILFFLTLKSNYPKVLKYLSESPTYKSISNIDLLTIPREYNLQ